ncbi:LLM class F420-dependent oxidoreductase [Streptomyces sp. NPDC057137]|uniref:LLM class F420-dependent oxidoreductase n=1 Tax=Streptomyces sp. NPDC057137 TaxID=3346030 RepID=UPI003625CCC5
MQLGLHICQFDFAGGSAAVGPTLAKTALMAEEVGFESITLSDHLFQTQWFGPHDDPMLEAYATLGYLAGVTSSVRLGTLVTSAVYRAPGMLVKAVTALDVLSGGRAFLGLGSGWDERESIALGLPFPPIAERFERLEEVLQIARQMWSANNGAFAGKHYRLAATVNSPQSIQRPYPPILIGGSGEKKTLKLVAKYADACNIAGGGPGAGRKLDVLREHCEREGRDYDDITKTSMMLFDTSDRSNLVSQLRELHDLGFTTVYGITKRVDDFAGLEILADVLQEIRDW